MGFFEKFGHFANTLNFLLKKVELSLKKKTTWGFKDPKQALDKITSVQNTYDGFQVKNMGSF